VTLRSRLLAALVALTAIGLATAAVVTYHEVGEFEAGGFVGVAAGAAQHRAYAGDELLQAERLGHVVVAADGEAFDLLLRRVACGQEHDRHVMAVGAEPLDHREAVAVGEHDIEHHEVGAERLRRPERFGAIARDLHAEPLVPEGGRDEIRYVGFVVDNEDAGISHTRMMAYQPVCKL